MIPNDTVVVDISSVCFTMASGIFTYTKQLDQRSFNNAVINHIKSAIKSHLPTATKVIIGVDTPPYWRRIKYDFYKANRVKDLSDDPNIFPIMQYFKYLKEILEVFKSYGWIVVNVAGAEGDDVCAIVSKLVNENLLVISSDHDITQVIDLYPKKNIKQYSSRSKQLIDASCYCIATHILKGDGGDGIPAYNQPDNVFLINKEDRVKRKTITKQYIEVYKTRGHDFFKRAYCTKEEMPRLDRNLELVSFTKIPKEIEDAITDAILVPNKPKVITFEEFLKENENAAV